MATRQEQEALYTSLARRSPKLARIYRGGLVVLSDENNPCRFELAAQSLRELIEKSPLLTNGQAFPQGDTMGNRIKPAREIFDAGVRSQNLDDTTGLEAAAGPIRALARELAKFFEWQDSNRPKRRERAAKSLSELSGFGPQLPIDFFEAEVERWLEAEDYLTDVAHNRYDNVDRDQFLGHMDLVERTLLRRLQPRSIEHLRELDTLIRGAENGQ
jgi:hypothetical protein